MAEAKEEQQALLDAIGNPIVEGKRYGYSSGASGFVRVVQGKATKQHASGKVTLTDLNVQRFLYGKPIIPDDVAKHVAVLSRLLFPV